MSKTRRAATIAAAISIFVAVVTLVSVQPSPIGHGAAVAAWFGILVAAGLFRSHLWYRVIGAGLGTGLLAWIFGNKSTLNPSTLFLVVAVAMVILTVVAAWEMQRAKQKHS